MTCGATNSPKADKQQENMRQKHSKADNHDGQWTFEIRGILPGDYHGDYAGSIPMCKKREDILPGTFDPEDDLSPEDFKE
jgi:hypothetical protein